MTIEENNKVAARVEALITDSKDHANHSENREPPMITPNRRSRRLEEKRGKIRL